MKNDPTSIDNLKEEVYQAELAFAEMAKKEGIDKAFLYFAADDAVLSRNNTVISGKKAIQTYFEGLPKMEQSLSWEPDFVDVSASGDMAYTYGKYLYTAVDSNGVKRESKGIFHTVWKRQQDGTWKYVWD